MPERIGDAGKPGIVSGGAPFGDLLLQVRQHRCVRRVGREIDYLIGIRAEIVEFLGGAVCERLQAALA